MLQLAHACIRNSIAISQLHKGRLQYNPLDLRHFLLASTIHCTSASLQYCTARWASQIARKSVATMHALLRDQMLSPSDQVLRAIRYYALVHANRTFNSSCVHLRNHFRPRNLLRADLAVAKHSFGMPYSCAITTVDAAKQGGVRSSYAVLCRRNPDRYASHVNSYCGA